MTEQTSPIRKSLLPCTPPAEWEFSSVLAAPHGVALIPDSDTGPIVVRRRVTYGDWEPVRPDHWAPEPVDPEAPRAVASPDSELDPARRYLVPVARLQLPDQPALVHLSVYEWLPQWDHWATGLALCGYSTEQGALPEGTAVTCPECEAYRPQYERYLAPGYKPGDDDLKALRARAEKAETLLREVLELADVTHKYPIQGGHDTIGENLTCAGCALAVQIREHLGEGR